MKTLLQPNPLAAGDWFLQAATKTSGFVTFLRIHMMAGQHMSFGYVEQRLAPRSDELDTPRMYSYWLCREGKEIEVRSLRVGMDMLELMYQNSQKGATT
jgi:hypothetical protein